MYLYNFITLNLYIEFFILIYGIYSYKNQSKFYILSAYNNYLQLFA